jgi:peptidoglycan/xylan/chitin deacetylase (PgdA/CDA1 family)
MLGQASLFSALLSLALCAHAQSVALTFDDGLNPHGQPEAAAWNQSILTALAEAEVTAMLLLACKNAESAEGMQLVAAWEQAGHSIANHTYSHRNLANPALSAEAFIADVEKCGKVLDSLPGSTARLRFPYLKEGETAEKRDAVRRWMTRNGYRPAPVSIDASDWYYSSRFLEWRKANPDGDVDAYRQAYLAHLWNRASYYDDLSKRVLGRSVKHVLLLHTNAINAAFLPDVIAMFRSRGWSIISPEEAFADPVYAMQPNMLPAGEGILWALAKQAGIEGLRYPAEDGEYEAALVDEAESRARSNTKRMQSGAAE